LRREQVPMVSAADRAAYERDARTCMRKGEVAIPTQAPGLAHGARLDSERFPLAWKA
jgi:hypothetical protein